MTIKKSDNQLSIKAIFELETAINQLRMDAITSNTEIAKQQSLIGQGIQDNLKQNSTDLNNAIDKARKANKKAKHHTAWQSFVSGLKEIGKLYKDIDKIEANAIFKPSKVNQNAKAIRHDCSLVKVMQMLGSLAIILSTIVAFTTGDPVLLAMTVLTLSGGMQAGQNALAKAIGSKIGAAILVGVVMMALSFGTSDLEAVDTLAEETAQSTNSTAETTTEETETTTTEEETTQQTSAMTGKVALKATIQGLGMGILTTSGTIIQTLAKKGLISEDAALALTIATMIVGISLIAGSNYFIKYENVPTPITKALKQISSLMKMTTPTALTEIAPAIQTILGFTQIGAASTQITFACESGTTLANITKKLNELKTDNTIINQISSRNNKSSQTHHDQTQSMIKTQNEMISNFNYFDGIEGEATAILQA